MPKRILIFSTAYLPFVGGAEVAIKEITDRITDTQFDLITARFKKSLPKFEKIGNINVYRLGVGVSLFDKLLVPFWGAIKTLSLNRRCHYSAYWCVMVSFASGAAYLANALKFWKPVPIILTLQEGDSEEHLTYRWFGLLNLSWKFALKHATEVTALSSYLAQRANRLGYKKEVKIIPNGVDTTKFQFSPPNFSSADIWLLTTSRLVVKNGIADVIKALPLLLENIKFLVLGGGELKSDLEHLTKKLGISDRVVFKGVVSHQEIQQYFKKSHIFIRPSLSEGQGVSFVEAMAAGLPVITTLVGGIPDFLKDHKTGLFCEVNNPQSIADRVMEYIKNPELTEKIIENAHKMVKEKYDWNLIAGEMKGVFTALNNKL